MKNDKGFTLIEALVAMSIIMMLMATIIPIDIFIKQERRTLYERRIIVAYLHDTLQHIVWNHDDLNSNVRLVNGKHVTVHYTNEMGLIKGCATWENAKQQKETKCLYGYKRK